MASSRFKIWTIFGNFAKGCDNDSFKNALKCLIFFVIVAVIFSITKTAFYQKVLPPLQQINVTQLRPG